MTMATVAHRNLDGSRVTIRSALNLDQPFTSILRLHLGTHLQEFDSGVAGSATASAQDLGVREFPYEYQFQRGRLRFGTTMNYDKKSKVRSSLTAAVWEGKRYSLFTHAYEAKSHKQLLAVLQQLRIAELADGLTVTAKRPAQTPVASVTLLKELRSGPTHEDDLGPRAGSKAPPLPQTRGERAVPLVALFLDVHCEAARGPCEPPRNSFAKAGARRSSWAFSPPPSTVTRPRRYRSSPTPRSRSSATRSRPPPSAWRSAPPGQ